MHLNFRNMKQYSCVCESYTQEVWRPQTLVMKIYLLSAWSSYRQLKRNGTMYVCNLDVAVNPILLIDFKVWRVCKTIKKLRRSRIWKTRLSQGKAWRICDNSEQNTVLKHKALVCFSSCPEKQKMLVKKKS